MFEPNGKAFNTFATVKPNPIAGYTGFMLLDKTDLLLANDHNLILQLPLRDIRHVTITLRAGDLALVTATGEQYILHTYGIPARLLPLRRAINLLFGIAGVSPELLNMHDQKTVLLHWAQQLQEQGIPVTIKRGKLYT